MATASDLPSDPAPPEATTKLRRSESDRGGTVLAELCGECGLKTTAAIAAYIGLSPRQTDRVVNHGDNPSGKFIAQALARWPRCSFRALFAVVDETTGEEVR